jgi:hypothetical protein
MGKRDKLNARVEALEAELLERLVPALATAADGKNDLVFLSSRIRPNSYPASVCSSEADELSELSETLVGLYEQLGIPSTGTPAARYLVASSDCYDYSNHHRAAPQGFAARLLAELRAIGA